MDIQNLVTKRKLLGCSNHHDDVPWLVGGDFNLMLWFTEKQGGGEFNFVEAKAFRQALDFCKLEDMQFMGHPFTWTNNQGGDDNLQERLDRFVANASWWDVYGSSFVTHLEKRKSDHLPLLLCIRTCLPRTREQKKRKLFRFEEM